MTGEGNRENVSGHGVGGGKRCERVEGGFREGHREVGFDIGIQEPSVLVKTRLKLVG